MDRPANLTFWIGKLLRGITVECEAASEAT
jgi:hypothetical protein